MTKKTWTIMLDDKTHKIELTHSNFSGKRSIVVDAEKVEIPRKERIKRWDTDNSP